MHSILLILHVTMAFALIGLILIQHGKGADAGAAFGSGASSTVFGASGSGSFLSRATGILALVFFANSFFLSYLSTTGNQPKGLMEQTEMATEGIEQATVNSETINDLPAADNKVNPDDLPDIADQADGETAEIPEAPTE